MSCHKAKLPSLDVLCIEDHLLYVDNKDTTFTIGCPVMHNIVFLEKYSYTYPKFNPANTDEIAFLRKDNSSYQTPALYKFNFCTEELTLIQEDITGEFDWSMNDWMLFSKRSDRSINKIKSTGDSLVRLTAKVRLYLKPKWSNEAKTILYKQNGNAGRGPYFLITDSNGVQTDTIFDFVPNKWNWNNQLTFSNRNRVVNSWDIGIYDLHSNQINLVDSFIHTGTNDSLILHLQYLKYSDEIIWQQNKQIGITDVENKKRKVLLQSSDARKYLSIDVSKDEKLVITSRENIRKTSECEIEKSSWITIIDIESGVERRLLFPE